MIYPEIMNLCLVLKPLSVAGPVLFTIALTATCLLIKSNISGIRYRIKGYERKPCKSDNNPKEGPISLELRRAVNEFMHN